MKILTAYVPSIGNIHFPGTKPGVTDAVSLLVAVANWLLAFAAALAVVAIIYSGIMYIMAGGDAEKAATARKNLTWAIIGVVVILLALVIMNWVNQILR